MDAHSFDGRAGRHGRQQQTSVDAVATAATAASGNSEEQATVNASQHTAHRSTLHSAQRLSILVSLRGTIGRRIFHARCACIRCVHITGLKKQFMLPSSGANPAERTACRCNAVCGQLSAAASAHTCKFKFVCFSVSVIVDVIAIDNRCCKSDRHLCRDSAL